MKSAILVILLFACGCDALPRDPEHTADRVAAQLHFTIGFGDDAARSDPRAQALIAVLERQTGARAVPVAGTGDPLLYGLTEGKVDLVLGHFARKSPWETQLTFGPPLATRRARAESSDLGPLELKAAMRNGENKWITQVERASRSALPKVVTP